MSKVDEIVDAGCSCAECQINTCTQLALENYCRELESQVGFKQAILAGDNPDCIFLENDRYWLTGKHLTEILSEYTKTKDRCRKLEAVAEAARNPDLESGEAKYYKWSEAVIALKEALKALDEPKEQFSGVEME